MKKLAIAIPVLLSLSLAGCLKDKPNVDFSTTNSQYVAEISTSSVNSTTNAPSGGLAFFAGATLDASKTGLDTVTFTVNIASDYPPTKDIAVTLGINDAARAAYIADASKVQFLAWPSNAYTFPVTKGTVHAGQRLDTFSVYFNHDNLDPTQSYMLPISITDASGTTISGNLSTIYFHIVGNPLAGTYTWDFTRWNATDSTSANTGHSVKTTAFVPVSPTNVEVASGYYIGPRYEINFTNTNGVLSNLTVTMNADDVKEMALPANGVTITDGPNIIVADLVNKYFEFQYQANTPTGPRYIIDKYYK